MKKLLLVLLFIVVGVVVLSKVHVVVKDTKVSADNQTGIPSDFKDGITKFSDGDAICYVYKNRTSLGQTVYAVGISCIPNN